MMIAIQRLKIFFFVQAGQIARISLTETDFSTFLAEFETDNIG